MNIKLKADSRFQKYNFKKNFGQAFSIPDEFKFDSVFPNVVQQPGNVQCVPITICDTASDQDNIIYDYNDLWNRIPQFSSGSSPQDGLGETIRNGLLKMGSSEPRTKNWKSYWSTGNFQETISAMWLAQSSGCIWTNWYDNYPANGILGIGKNPTGAHMYEIKGVKIIDGEKMFIIEAWVGYDLYMGKEAFEKETKKWGCGTAMLSTFQVDARREKTILEAIIDAYKNIIIALQLLVNQQKVMPIPDPTPIAVPVETDRERLYNLEWSLKGKYLTLNPTVSKNLNCAQCVSFILNKAGYKIPKGGISGTYTMYEFLMKSYTQVSKNEFSKGDIIISVTGMGIKGSRGHVGIYDGVSRILSNDSNTGLLKDNWTLTGWIGKYQTTQKMPTFYFRVK